MNWKVFPSPQMTPAKSAQWRFGQSLIHAPATCESMSAVIKAHIPLVTLSSSG